MSRSKIDGGRTIVALDCETDPFRKGRPVAPFVVGIYDGTIFLHWWGADCFAQCVAYLRERPDKLLIYAHNGGRFDYLFMLSELEPEVSVINGRIVKAKLGAHELRDSFTILPVPLADANKKTAFDYQKLRRAVRDRHRPEIVSYLRDDCVNLREAVQAFRERFGHKLTMAGAAISKLDAAIADDTGHDAKVVLQKLRLHARGVQDAGSDPYLRQFFFGGRTEYFERGVQRDAWRVYDVNSMYPHVMATVSHPTGADYVAQRAVDDRTDFVIVDATARGCFPLRAPDGGLSFPHMRAEYRVTGHELRAALEMGMVQVHKVLRALHCPVRTDFRAFVEPYYALRQAADAAGDKTGKLHFKLVLNSSYGRFSLHPGKLREWRVLPRGTFPEDGSPDRPWRLSYLGEAVAFWSRPATDASQWRALRNVGTGASITGAARAVLLRALATAERPIYCDTDSIIARSIDAEFDDRRLGAWKMETQADKAAIVGKKTYALFAGAKCVKHASKGAKLTPRQILLAAGGKKIVWRSDAPTITIAGIQTPLTRTVQIT